MLGGESGAGDGVMEAPVATAAAAGEDPAEPVMPSPPFPTFQNTPTLPHQAPGNGFESGRDSRAR